MRHRTNTIHTGYMSLPTGIAARLHAALAEDVVRSDVHISINTDRGFRGRTNTYLFDVSAVLLGETRIATFRADTRFATISGIGRKELTLPASPELTPLQALEQLLESDAAKDSIQRRLAAFDLAGAVIDTSYANGFHIAPSGDPDWPVVIRNADLMLAPVAAAARQAAKLAA